MKHKILTTKYCSLSFDGDPPDGGLVIGFFNSVDTYMMGTGDEAIDMLKSEGVTIVGLLSISVGDGDSFGIGSGSRIGKCTIYYTLVWYRYHHCI